MTGWKIHHEWRCISYWKWGFSNAMLVFRGVPPQSLTACRPWKMMVGRWSFPFGFRPAYFQGRTVKLCSTSIISWGRFVEFQPSKKHILQIFFLRQKAQEKKDEEFLGTWLRGSNERITCEDLCLLELFLGANLPPAYVDLQMHFF